ncbi:hypothetical protein [Bacillus sp. FF-1]|uniref:hypothetical protein n=1 Tax=Bacillus sp. FF-1 TaxID=3025192 RepID=UPI00234E7D3B|nr:hypothetical protein [Bacillus sp. FF-1]MDC7739532.1 hypothetical protein [Bacillus sp. FF-1]
MFIKKIKVKGKLQLELEFREKNVILGKNNAGKSTLMNLIIYALGSKVDDFITEIKKGKCQQVELDVLCKSGNLYRFIRGLPYSEAVTVIPFDNDENLLEDEMDMLNISEFSDFLLKEEGYQPQNITFSGKQHAALRFYFLLRAVFVDQNTNAISLLANIGGRTNGFINNQRLIKKAIIEELLGKENQGIQQMRFEMQSLIKQRAEFKSTLNVINQIIKKESENDRDLIPKIEYIKGKIEEILVQKNNLSTSKVENIFDIKIQNDNEFDRKLKDKKNQRESHVDYIRKLKLELMDIEEVIDQFEKELEDLRKMMVARQIFTQIPIDSCPVCLNKISMGNVKENCSYCNHNPNADNEENSLKYKKMLQESLKESLQLRKELKEVLTHHLEMKEDLDSEIQEMNNIYIENVQAEKTPLDEMVQSIKERYEYLIKMENSYSDFLRHLEFRELIQGQMKEVNDCIKTLKDELTALENHNSVEDISKINHWEYLFSSVLGITFGEQCKIAFTKDYIPIINGDNAQTIASASLKVAIRLAYVVSLFKLKDIEDINHLGFILLDSPKDKDLDQNKYRRFLEITSASESGQIILTGSIEEEHLYDSAFREDQILLRLNEGEKLLKESV